MTHAIPGAANDVAHLNKLHEQDSVNLESPSAEIANRALAQAAQEPAGESAGEGGGRLAPDAQNAPAANCESFGQIADSLALEIDRAPAQHLGELIRRVWAACAEGKLDADTAGELDQRARERQGRGRVRPNPFPTVTSRRRPPRSPDRQRSLERRRRESSSGLFPPAIAAKFTEGERAVLAVIAKEIKLRRRCDLYNDQLATYAGVSVSTVKNAKRRARWLQLIEIEEWKQAPDWNGPSTIKVIDQSWLVWLAHHRELKMTVKAFATTRNQDSNTAKPGRGERPREANRGSQQARFSHQLGP